MSDMSPEDRERFINEIPDPPMHWDRLGVPIPLREWGELCEDFDYKVIGQTLVNDRWFVSTIWLGLDAGLGSLFGGPPLIFETIVFDHSGEDHEARFHDWELHRYPTEADARFGHSQMVALVEALESADAPNRTDT